MSRKQLARSGGDLSRLGTDDAGATMLHLDMDSFFVSVELLSRPQLIGLPVIVGGRSGRGVVVSASYEAREFGVHAAMPMSRAMALCPVAEVIPPSHGLYSSYSRQVFDIVAEVTPEVRQVSVDEAYIDVSGAVRRLGPPATITARLRAQIKETTGLSASVGIAGSQVVAKLASARAKPDGQLLVPVAKTQEFLDPMPIEALPGVGEKTQQALSRYGIRLIGDLAAVDEDWAARVFGAHGHQLWRSAHGQDSAGFDREAKDHSISAENTFGEDIWDLGVLGRQGRLPGPCGGEGGHDPGAEVPPRRFHHSVEDGDGLGADGSGPGDVRGAAAGAAEAARAADPGSQAARCPSRGAHRLRGRRTASDLGRTGAFGAGGRGGAGRGEAPIRDRIDLSGLTSAQTPGLLIGGEPDHSLKTQWESGPQATPEMFFQCSQTMIESKT